METPDVPDLPFPFKHAISCNIQVQNFVQTTRKALNDVTALLSESKIATAQAEDLVCCLVRGVKIGDKRCRGISVVCVGYESIFETNYRGVNEQVPYDRQFVRGKSRDFLLSGSCTGGLPMWLS